MKKRIRNDTLEIASKSALVTSICHCHRAYRYLAPCIFSEMLFNEHVQCSLVRFYDGQSGECVERCIQIRQKSCNSNQHHHEDVV